MAATEKFDRMIQLEQDVRDNRVLADLGSDLDIKARGRDNLKKATAELSALVSAMDMPELVRFQEYRTAHLAA